MNIEEKAKAYDEALALAKRLISNNCTEVEKLCLKCVFPELKESEDERIIEEIKFAVMQMPSERQDTKNRCLAWLEKQKLNPDKKELIRQCVGSILTDATDERFKDYGLTLKDCLTWLDEQEEQKSGELDKIERLMKALQVTNAQIGELVEENYKLKEQKSDNYSEERKLNHEWASEDWSMLCDIRRYIEGTGSSSGITNQERAAWLCELPKRFSLEGKEQEPSEWSGVTVNGEPISIENKSVDIPLVEWSEEDEENISTLIEVVHERMGLSEKRKQYYEKWLKSLRHKHNTVSTRDAIKFGT